MKKLLIGVLACACMTAFGKTYYVDANHGDDAWDGEADFEHRDEGPGIGPCRTLVQVMSFATSGDVVYAAPGEYKEGSEKRVNTALTYNRVVIPAGVRLESTEGAEKTFIVGADATTSPDAFGRGSGATRCVALMGTDSSIVGFTLTGGRTATAAGTSKYDHTGGAVIGPANIWYTGTGYPVYDCIVSNNVAKQCSAGAGITWVRCNIVQNGRTDDGSGNGGCCQVGRFYACNFDGNLGAAQDAYQPQAFNACRANKIQIGHDSNDKYAYNSVIGRVDQVNAKEHAVLANCVYGTKGSAVRLEGNCQEIGAAAYAAMGYDIDGRTSSKIVRDAGNNAWLNSATYPTEYGPEFDKGKGPRIYGAVVDVGPYEHDIRPDIAAALAPERVAVPTVTPNVRVTQYDLPILTNASEMTVAWTAKGVGEIAYGFTAEVTGAGTLSCYKDNEAEPFETATAADGAKQIPFTSSLATVPLRFTFAGEGSANVRQFVDEVSATITDAKAPNGGLTLEGIGLGKTVVEPGQTLTFTVKRNFNTDRLCTGFVLNGSETVDFNDYPDGWEHTLDTPFSSVVIEAQYKTVQDFYVDPVNGDNGKSGFLPSEAWLTLTAIATNANVRSGDVVYALPGTYDKGALLLPDWWDASAKKYITHTTYNRVIVPEGVTLKSLEGAEKTIIVGAPSPNPDAQGRGVGATRCAALNLNSTLTGFTLTGGHTGTVSKGFPDGECAATIGTGLYVVARRLPSRTASSRTTSRAIVRWARASPGCGAALPTTRVIMAMRPCSAGSLAATSRTAAMSRSRASSTRASLTAPLP